MINHPSSNKRKIGDSFQTGPVQMEDQNTLELHIYDLDGTLFRSPEPNPAHWHPNVFEQIMLPPIHGGLGWFQEVITLSEPFVPSSPDPSWFHMSVLEQCRKSIANKNCVTVLMTGRTEAYRDLINGFLKAADLKFDHILLKPISRSQVISTMSYKLSHIRNLVVQYRPAKVHMYEDRERHVEQFRYTLGGLNLNHTVFHVKEKANHLSQQQEFELVSKLIEINGGSRKLTKVTQFDLDNISRRKLNSWIVPPHGWRVKKEFANKDFFNDFKHGDKVEIRIVKIGLSHKALVFHVEEISKKSITHFVFAASPLAQSQDYSEIKHWFETEHLNEKAKIITLESLMNGGINPQNNNNSENITNNNENNNDNNSEQSSSSIPTSLLTLPTQSHSHPTFSSVMVRCLFPQEHPIVLSGVVQSLYDFEM
eukprot:TRINITY_DN1721_c0_g2_i2.p1 TRINITY_DN1721_c0_g2~~TRINITY_DN1721_c0_g2_i2.p1  ORF type:complete len:424 (+),score=73.85 TRINITY_DN1721_c0_g2_i2:752-2023(+)